MKTRSDKNNKIEQSSKNFIENIKFSSNWN